MQFPLKVLFAYFWSVLSLFPSFDLVSHCSIQKLILGSKLTHQYSVGKQFSMVIVCEISVYCSTKNLFWWVFIETRFRVIFRTITLWLKAKRLVLVQLAYVFSKASFLKVFL